MPHRTFKHEYTRLVVALAVLTAPAVADEPRKAGSVEAELKKLEGTWEGFAVDGKGEKPDRGPVHLRLTISGTKMSAVDLGNSNRDMGNGAYKIDPTQKVKTIDATGVVLPGKRERTFLGIYEIDGDTLKWCVDNRSKERPSEFRTGNGKYLLVLKRKK